MGAGLLTKEPCEHCGHKASKELGKRDPRVEGELGTGVEGLFLFLFFYLILIGGPCRVLE